MNRENFISNKRNNEYEKSLNDFEDISIVVGHFVELYSLQLKNEHMVDTINVEIFHTNTII
jgi:hypothetical protein